MRIIKTRQDVEDLHRDGATTAALTEHVTEFFRQLEAELADDEEDMFCLDQHGLIALLEAGDDLCSCTPLRDTLKDGTVVIRRYYACNNFLNGGRTVCSSNSVRADLVENFVFERIAEAIQKPKTLEDVVDRMNKDRTKSVVPL